MLESFLETVSSAHLLKTWICNWEPYRYIQDKQCPNYGYTNGMNAINQDEFEVIL